MSAAIPFDVVLAVTDLSDAARERVRSYIARYEAILFYSVNSENNSSLMEGTQTKNHIIPSNKIVYHGAYLIAVVFSTRCSVFPSYFCPLSLHLFLLRILRIIYHYLTSNLAVLSGVRLVLMPSSMNVYNAVCEYL